LQHSKIEHTILVGVTGEFYVRVNIRERNAEALEKASAKPALRPLKLVNLRE